MLIFEQYTEVTEISKQSSIFDENMKPILVDFWDYGIPELEVNNIKSLSPLHIGRNKYINNQEDTIVEKIDFFL